MGYRVITRKQAMDEAFIELASHHDNRPESLRAVRTYRPVCAVPTFRRRVRSAEQIADRAHDTRRDVWTLARWGMVYAGDVCKSSSERTVEG